MTSTSTVGLPRESRTSRPAMCSMMLMDEGSSSWAGQNVHADGGGACRRTRDAVAARHRSTRRHLRSSAAVRARAATAERSRRLGGELGGADGVAVADGGGPQRGLGVDPGEAGLVDHGEQEVADGLVVGDPWAAARAVGQRRSPPRPRRGRRRRGSPPSSAPSGRRAAPAGAGMPSNTLSRPFSAFLICSQLATTASASSASTSPNTCGCRRDELVVHASWPRRPAVNWPSSVASGAWNTTWNSRSPSSSSRCS